MVLTKRRSSLCILRDFMSYCSSTHIKRIWSHHQNFAPRLSLVGKAPSWLSADESPWPNTTFLSRLLTSVCDSFEAPKVIIDHCWFVVCSSLKQTSGCAKYSDRKTPWPLPACFFLVAVTPQHAWLKAPVTGLWRQRASCKRIRSDCSSTLSFRCRRWSSSCQTQVH